MTETHIPDDSRPNTVSIKIRPSDIKMKETDSSAKICERSIFSNPSWLNLRNTIKSQNFAFSQVKKSNNKRSLLKTTPAENSQSRTQIRRYQKVKVHVGSVESPRCGNSKSKTVLGRPKYSHNVQGAYHS